MIGKEMDEGSTSETKSSDRYSLQLKAYAKVDADGLTVTNSRRIPVMVSIMELSGTMERRHAPVDIVLVLHIHVRCLAPANWHDFLCMATELIVEKLGENDNLAIVPSLSKETRIIFEDAVIVPVNPKLLPMSSENKAAVCTSVKTSEAMRSNAPLLRDLESAESILYRRESKDREERPSYIIVISNSNEDLSTVLTWRFRSVHAFGFHEAHNARTMYTIASIGGGTYSILNDGDQITEDFAVCIDKITSAAEPVEVHLKCNEEVVLSAIDAPRICYFMSYDRKMGIIWANARCGMATKFIIYMDIPHHYYENEYSRLLNIQVRYGHPPVPVKEPPVLVTVSKGQEGKSVEVAAEMVRMEAVKIVAEICAADKEGNEDLHEVAIKLHERWISVQNSNYCKEAAEAGLTKGLAAVMQEMERRLRDNDSWLEYMLSWRSQQWWPLPPVIKDNISRGTWTKSEAIQSPEIMSSLDKAKQEERTKTKSRLATYEETISHPLLRLRVLANADGDLPVQMQRGQRGIPVLVHIAVLPVEGLEEKRAPVDLVAVLDVSCRIKDTVMKRMEVLDKAMGFTIQTLSHVDRLAIVPVQSSVTKPAVGLTEMTENGRSACRKMLSDLASAASMNNEEQNSYGRQPFKKPMCRPITTVKTYGTFASGSNDLSKSMKLAVKLLDDRQADNKGRMGFIIVISDRDDISICKRTLRSNYAVNTFSFHDADNARAMHHIATTSSSGIYALLNNSSGEVTKAFTSSIRKITSIVGVNTRVNLLCNSDSRLRFSRVESGRFKTSIDRQRKSVSISAGAIYPGASRRFVAYLDNVREDSYYNLYTMLRVNMVWQDASNNEAEEKLEGPGNIVRGKLSNEVMEEIVRIEGLRIVSSITNHRTIGAVLTMLQELRNHLRVRASYVGVHQPPNVSGSWMDVDHDILASLVTAMDADPLSYMLSWLSFEGLCEKVPLGTA